MCALPGVQHAESTFSLFVFSGPRAVRGRRFGVRYVPSPRDVSKVGLLAVVALHRGGRGRRERRRRRLQRHNRGDRGGEWL